MQRKVFSSNSNYSFPLTIPYNQNSPKRTWFSEDDNDDFGYQTPIHSPHHSNSIICAHCLGPVHKPEMIDKATQVEYDQITNDKEVQVEANHMLNYCSHRTNWPLFVTWKKVQTIPNPHIFTRLTMDVFYLRRILAASVCKYDHYNRKVRK